MHSNMSLSAFVFGCTPDGATPVAAAPAPTPSDFLPPAVDHLVDTTVIETAPDLGHNLYDYTRRDIDVIVGGDF